jgi:hypothetical protein
MDEITRYIKPEVQRELWGRVAARCQFSDCNRLLYKSPVTQERVNLAEMAHIYSFSTAGPRGRGALEPKTDVVNDISNLMLVCHDCHKKIDSDKEGVRYSASLLKEWKHAHEQRVSIVTGIAATKRSHVVLYGSRIGAEDSSLHAAAAMEAMFPHSYPAAEVPVLLSMRSEHDDSTQEFWASEVSHLQKAFDRHIRVRIEEAQPNHFSIFGLAAQPLLILLGSLFTDKVPANVYQFHREPRTWQWQPYPDSFEFKIHEPSTKTAQPVLLLSLSARIHPDRIAPVIKGEPAIWELTIDDCHNDFLRSEAQLAMFRQAARKLMAAIKAAHPDASELKIFPAMPVSCALELGRIRMPKADLPWRIYDQNHKHNRFIETITIGNPHE